jgi:hypothetical protein
MSTIKLRRALRWGETNLYSVKVKTYNIYKIVIGITINGVLER